jgi:hypothetical protein
VEASDVARLLPPSAIGLSGATLARLSALDVPRLSWPAEPAVRLALRESVPVGLARTFLAQLGDEVAAAALLRSCNAPGPVTLRANLAMVPHGQSGLVRSLRASGVACRAGTLSPWAVTLDAPTRASYGGSVWALPGWAKGEFEVLR